MKTYPYHLTGPIGTAATLGLVVLQVDETIEQDFRRLFPSGEIALYVSRVASGTALTRDTITQMAVDLPQAVGLLPPAVAFDAIGYACTSGTTLIGAKNVAQMVAANAQTRAVCDPLSASIAALMALNTRAVGIVSPYVADVALPIQQAFVETGFAVPHSLSFGEEIEQRVARIDPASIHAAALDVGQHADVDAVFLSCTNLRTLDIITDLEAQLGKPVVSSNQALAWHMARSAGVALATGFPGQLGTV
ncbi:Asp/Glu racemase [Yoonia sp. I 8.24]|uniref:maleate cis-trans isomerase family protein n=1 Tax=Yoonia sp. I 8.24 TaxID=1537229 RepID=UPI001EDCB0BC|nr:Asp/Glu racemase [Yoonia sp. I 8.24]